MNLNNVLASVIQTATGYPALALEHDPQGPVPSTVYRIIGDMPIVDTSGADTKLSWARVQLTSIANTYSSLRTLVDATEAVMIGKTTDWQVSVPLVTKLEDKEDNLYYSIREYSIWYTKD